MHQKNRLPAVKRWDYYCVTDFGYKITWTALEVKLLEDLDFRVALS